MSSTCCAVGGGGVNVVHVLCCRWGGSMTISNSRYILIHIVLLYDCSNDKLKCEKGLKFAKVLFEI